MKKSIFTNKKLNKRNAGWEVQHDTNTVINRAIALCYVCPLAMALGTNDKDTEKHILSTINNKRIKGIFTEKELEFIFGKRMEQDIFNFSWHYERLKVLLWALGQKVSLDNWVEMVNIPELIEIINASNFAHNSKLIKSKKIADYEQDANEAYWICLDARLNKRQISYYSQKSISSEIVMERLIAVRWLYSSEETEWDYCSPDTYFPYERPKGSSDKIEKYFISDEIMDRLGK